MGCLPLFFPLPVSDRESSSESSAGRGVRVGDGGSFREIDRAIESSRPRPA